MGEGNGNPLQSSCLENPMDGGAWWAAVHGVAKSWTWLSDFTFTSHFHASEKEMATHSSVLAWRISRNGGAWWAVVYGVAQSRTRLKWLSSSTSSSSTPGSGLYVRQMGSWNLALKLVFLPVSQHLWASPVHLILIYWCVIGFFRLKKFFF